MLDTTSFTLSTDADPRDFAHTVGVERGLLHSLLIVVIMTIVVNKMSPVAKAVRSMGNESSIIVRLNNTAVIIEIKIP